MSTVGNANSPATISIKSEVTGMKLQVKASERLEQSWCYLRVHTDKTSWYATRFSTKGHVKKKTLKNKDFTVKL